MSEFDNFANEMARIRNLVNKRMAEVSKIANKIRSYDLTEPLRKINEAQNSFRNAFTIIADGMSKFIAEMNHRSKLWQEFSNELARLNYPPIYMPDFNDIEDRVELIRNAKNRREKIEIIDSFFVDRYRNEENVAELIDILDETKWLGRRKEMIAQLLKAHKHEMYYMSIPNAFSQVEGIFADAFPECRDKQSGRFDGGQFRDAMEKAFSVTFDSENYKQDDWYKHYKRVILRSRPYNKDTKELSRHLIIHGKAYNYGTEVNSAKAIAILEYAIFTIYMYKAIVESEN